MAKTRTSFKKGQINNPNGRPKKGYSITETMKKMLRADPNIKKALSQMVLQKAIKGDLAAAKVIWSYMDGTPISTLELTGKDGGPLEIEARAIYTPLQLKVISEGYADGLKEALEIKSGK